MQRTGSDGHAAAGVVESRGVRTVGICMAGGMGLVRVKISFLVEDDVHERFWEECRL